MTVSGTGPTYYAIPANVDFGTVAVGSSPVKTVEVEFRLAPTGSAGGFVTTQINVSNEVFLVDDQGNDADDFVTISTDNVNFFNRLNLSSFPAQDPPNNVTIYVKVAPTVALTNTQQDYVVNLRAVQNKSWILPIHFRIGGGRYVTPDDVRRIMGPFGKQRTSLQALQDTFINTAFPLWTFKTGSWGQSRTASITVANTATQDQIAVPTYFSDFGDYNASVTIQLTSSGDAGLIFGYVDNNNYFRAIVSSRNGNGEIDQVSGGVVTVLTQASVGVSPTGVVVGRNLNLRVEKHPTSVDFYVNDALQLRTANITPNGPPGMILTSSGGSLASVDFSDFHTTSDVFVFADADINGFIEDEEKFIEIRTGKIYVPTIVTEILDYHEQDVTRLPFTTARSFAGYPTGFPGGGAGVDRRAQNPPPDDHMVWLSKRPVMNVIAVEENTAPDASTDNWILKAQGHDGEYIAYPEQGKILFIDGFPRSGHQNIKVIYTVGTAGVPAYIRQYVAYKVAYDMLTGLGGAQDGIENMVKKIENKIVQLEEFIPQKTLIYGVGSGKDIR